MQRKPFMRVLARTVFGAALLSVALTPSQAASDTPLGPDAVAILKASLEPVHQRYDPAAQMLREPFHSPGYHTTLKGGEVHSTRNSLNYALNLLDTGDPALSSRAQDILRKVISLQDQRPDSRTYGIWPWFLEEPLEKMSPPDWNWADFCGVTLLQVARDHKHRLSPDTAKLVDDAILHAARSVQRRNVGPGYTNIAIMGSYVTLIAAELYGWPELLDYARNRWRRFHQYTREQGAFTEYNSPTYTVVALREIARMRAHARDPECKRIADELYRLAWREIAEHFHVPSRQWAGPHSRAYRTLLGPDTLALIQHATGNRVHFGSASPASAELRVPLDCPAEFEPYFLRTDSPRELRRVFQKSQPPVIGTTYLAPEFALGSVNAGDLWNQRRPLLAYWGTAAQPRFLRPRFLHNGYDFSAAQFFSAQDRGTVLAAIVFATDGGDTHISLDRLKDGAFEATDLRLRFEFGGAARFLASLPPKSIPGSATVQDGDLRIRLDLAAASFGTCRARWETGKDSETAWLDLVVYAGTNRSFRLADLDKAVVAFALTLSTQQSAPAETTATELAADSLRIGTGSLKLTVPIHAATAGALRRAVRLE